MKQALVHSLENSLYQGNTSGSASRLGRDISPNRVKIQQISEKMTTMASMEDEEKVSRRIQYEEKIKHLEEKI